MATYRITAVGDHEVRAWLGPAYDEMTPEQVEQTRRALADIEDRYPDPDDADLRAAAATAAAQLILGETTLEAAGQSLAAARLAEAEARAAARQVAVMAAGRGETEAGIARALGVDRMAVRAWLGKR